MSVYRITIPGDPVSANHYKRLCRTQSGITTYLTKAAREYQDRVRLAAMAAGVRTPMEGDLCVTIRYCHRYPKQRQDLGNIEKVCLDSLQGIAFLDDKQIVWMQLEREYAPDDPRLEVTVEEKE